VARALVQLHATADPLLPRVVLPSQQRGALSSAVHKRAKWSVLIAIPQSFTAPPSVIFLTLPPPLLRILSSSTISRSQHFNERRRYRHSTTATSDDIRRLFVLLSLVLIKRPTWERAQLSPPPSTLQGQISDTLSDCAPADGGDLFCQYALCDLSLSAFLPSPSPTR